jgi:hypothetical protein
LWLCVISFIPYACVTWLDKYLVTKKEGKMNCRAGEKTLLNPTQVPTTMIPWYTI